MSSSASCALLFSVCPRRQGSGFTGIWDLGNFGDVAGLLGVGTGNFGFSAKKANYLYQGYSTGTARKQP